VLGDRGTLLNSRLSSKGFLCYRCDLETLNQLSVGPEDLCYVICEQQQLKDILLNVKSFDTEDREKVRIDVVADDSISTACKSIHRGYLWLKQRGLNDPQIVTYTSLKDERHLEAIFTAGFFKIPVFVKDPYSSRFFILSSCEDFAHLDLQSAISNFNNMNFVHAKLIFETIERQAHQLRNIYVFRLLSSLCDFYLQWENFQYFEARKTLDRLLQDIKILEKEYKFLANIRASLTENQKFLDKLLSDSSNLTKLSLTLLLDVLLNGKRLESFKKYSEAAICYYRVLEGCIQYRFQNTYGVDTSKPDYSRLPLKEEELQKFLKGRLPMHIAFNDGYKILYFIGDDFAKELDPKLVKSIQQIRNYSILIHGVRPLTSTQCQTAGAFAEETLKKLFKKCGIDYEDLAARAKPCSLDYEFFMELFP
jgi:hypothetical protein